ncbi:hypothetical protein JCM8547_008122 [Rhodosporidiobolus lusitaniae]
MTSRAFSNRRHRRGCIALLRRFCALFIFGLCYAFKPHASRCLRPCLVNIEASELAPESAAWLYALELYHSSPNAPTDRYHRAELAERAVYSFGSTRVFCRHEQRVLDAVLDGVIERNNVKRMLREWEVEAIRVEQGKKTSGKVE